MKSDFLLIVPGSNAPDFPTVQISREALESYGAELNTTEKYLVLRLPVQAQMVLAKWANGTDHLRTIITHALILFGFRSGVSHTAKSNTDDFSITYVQELPAPPAASGGSRATEEKPQHAGKPSLRVVSQTAEYGEFAFVNCIQPGEGFRLLKTGDKIQETDEGTSDPKGRLWDVNVVQFSGQPFSAKSFSVRRRIRAEASPAVSKAAGLFPEVNRKPDSCSKVPPGTATNIREFPTGAVRDVAEGKEDYIESTSFVVLKRYAVYMTKSMVKYGPGNWRKGIPLEEYEKSLYRHWQKYLSNKYDGTDIEPEIDHLSAVMFNLQGIMHEEAREEARCAEAARKKRAQEAGSRFNPQFAAVKGAFERTTNEAYDTADQEQTKKAA